MKICHLHTINQNTSILILGGGVIQCPRTWSCTYKGGKPYEILIFSKYISHKKEIKVNNMTPDYVQNFNSL